MTGTEHGDVKDTVLVVDDNALNRELASAILGRAGYRVVLASSGQEALDLFRAEAPDLVLLDILMPGMDGFETCRQIRQLEHGDMVPILFLTALTEMVAHRDALDSGADDFLTKPINQTELLMRVRSLIRIRRMGRELHQNYELIREQADELLLAKAQRAELTALLAHDLKNHLMLIQGRADLVMLQPDKTEDHLDHAASISEAAMTMNRMVRNLLDISTSESGALEPRLAPVEVDEVISHVHREFSGQAGGRGARVETEVPPELPAVIADEDLLQRILENLVHNAVKHSPTGGRVVIEAALDEPMTIELRVRDEGPGIPDEHKGSIFDKYTQVRREGERGHLSGRGLGLAFCRLATEAHGGTIQVLDNQPKGAMFCVRLPVQAS